MKPFLKLWIMEKVRCNFVKQEKNERKKINKEEEERLNEGRMKGEGEESCKGEETGKGN